MMFWKKNESYHEPVMVDEMLEQFQVKPGNRYIDATLGDGGHTLELLKRGAEVMGIDMYEKAVERATKRIKRARKSKYFIGVNANFKDLLRVAQENQFTLVHGILFDLGYSSYQLEEGNFGLSFQKDEPLDMRMSTDYGVKAADLINALPEGELSNLFEEYGEEKLSKKFARAIARERTTRKIQTTKELSDIIVSEAGPGYERGRIHPATRVFQALRIVVNSDLDNLAQTLPKVSQLLLPGGRLVVITFHSLEDRVVKKIGHKPRPGRRPKPGLNIVNDMPITPSLNEIENNRRSRSAKMRVFEKIA